MSDEKIVMEAGPAPEIYDYHWNLKSTPEDRGRALLAMGVEWCGGDRRMTAEDVLLNAGEMVANLLWTVREVLGADEIDKVITQAFARYNEEVKLHAE